MASSNFNCGVCYLRHITKQSEVWCPECDEGLCVECQNHHGLSKGTRDHKVVTIDQYNKLPAKVLKISQFCRKHDDEKYTTFCKRHDSPCCRRCVIESHNDCKEYAAIDDVVNNVKYSSAFQEMEQSLSLLAETIEKLKNSKKENTASFKKQREMIENEIKTIRSKINKHLDNLQEDLLKELYAYEEKENIKINRLVISLEQQQSEVIELQTTITNVKKYASDLQTFLSMKQIERDVCNKDEMIRLIIEGQDIENTSLSFEVDNKISKIITEIQMFGKFHVRFRPPEIPLGRQKEKQAQNFISRVPVRSIESIKLTLQKTVNGQIGSIRGCALLPDGKIIITVLKSGVVKSICNDGTLDFKINLKHKQLFDIVYMADSNNVAVTSGDDHNRCITIIDLGDKKTKKIIRVDSKNFGITYNNGRLFSCVKYKGVMMVNLDNESISQVVAVDFGYESYIATYSNNIYYTNSGTVTCCDLQGSTKWKFQNKNLLSCPLGITVDNEGFVYVVDNSNRLVVISPDGKHCRQLLSAVDGLACPHVVDFQRSTNQLVVANSSDTIFQYRVTKD